MNEHVPAATAGNRAKVFVSYSRKDLAFAQMMVAALAKLLNLISNGFYAATKRKADADGGSYEPILTAATKNFGHSVEIKIRDNGTGIPSEVKEKMFNPFFTTKPAGEGSGLGLSISHDTSSSNMADLLRSIHSPVHSPNFGSSYRAVLRPLPSQENMREHAHSRGRRRAGCGGAVPAAVPTRSARWALCDGVCAICPNGTPAHHRCRRPVHYSDPIGHQHAGDEWS
jgi:hypothetical protein